MRKNTMRGTPTSAFMWITIIFFIIFEFISNSYAKGNQLRSIITNESKLKTNTVIELPIEINLHKIQNQSSEPVSLNINLPVEISIGKMNSSTSITTTGPKIFAGIGDTLKITVFGQPDMSAEVSVNEIGSITLPLIGNLKILNQTPQDIAKIVAMRLQEGEYLKNPDVSVEITQNRSQLVTVIGEVQKPGRYPLQGRLNVLELLATAGGLTPRSDRTIFLLRRNINSPESNSGEQIKIPIYLDSKSALNTESAYTELQRDDILFIEQQKLFYIYGEVKKPGAYPLESELNVMRAISIGGGITDRGSKNKITIHRQQGDNANDIHEIRSRLTDRIQAGDVIYVDERLF
jgi:polysaccharide biosynthesis/export protein